MADHVRKQIRAAVVSALSGLTTTGTRVYEGRTNALPGESAALLVDFGGEQIELQTGGGSARVNLREIELDVRAIVKGTGYLNTLDAIVLEVETALATNESLGGLAKMIQPTEFDRPDLDGTGDKTVAMQTMRFRISYMTALNAPAVAL